jgi:hypothetical protein
MQAYFQQRRAPSLCTAQDGVAVAHMLVDSADTSSHNRRESKKTVRKFAERTSMLRALGFPVSEMLATVVTGSHMVDPDCASDLLSPDSIDDPTLLTEEDATAMGGVFAGILRSGRTATPALSPAEAVRKLTEAFVALDIMGRKHLWFLPMLRTIAQRLLGMSIVDSVRRASSSNPVIRPTDGVRRASSSNAVRPVPLGLSSFDVVVRADPYYTFRV